MMLGAADGDVVAAAGGVPEARPFVQSLLVVPRRWSGFVVCMRVSEAWVTAWSVSRRAGSPASAREAAIRMAALGQPSSVWTAR